MLVDVERHERRRVPHRERVLGVADVVEQTTLVPVVGRPGPAATGDARRLEVGLPGAGRAEVTLDQIADGAVGIAAVAAEVIEVDLVVLHAADGERVVDLERAKVGVDLVRGGEIDLGEALQQLVPLVHVAGVELVVSLDRLTGDAIELEQRSLQRLRGDLDVVVGKRRHHNPFVDSNTRAEHIAQSQPDGGASAVGRKPGAGPARRRS